MGLEEKMKALQGMSLALALLAILEASAQVLVAGKCPRPAVVQFFDASRYLGKWYEIQKLPVLFQQGECATATYSRQGTGGDMEVLIKELLADGSTYAYVGSAMVTNSSEPAKMEVYYSPTSLPSPYWVLATDYYGHALAFGCIDYGLFHAQFAWVLSRQPTLVRKTLKDLQDLLASGGVNVDKMTPTNQNKAFCRAMV
ncbi:apolipoprotein D-like [Gadus chalcogrammus]|uniref:apolipoprotein D-like n=1 Tax=Gadus chalcogrammus TaxID=1042646 RepID=UPI0024C47DD9|nr:apolipoprotein D-like [Gadus chalcogrammus]